MKRRNRRARYGFDAPAETVALLTGAMGSIALAAAAFGIGDGWGRLTAYGFVGAAAMLLVSGLSRVAYSLVGKRRMRDAMLDRIAWRGDERVLDVGTGLGLMLIGAAKELGYGGRAIGVDIWRKRDLSGGGLDQLAVNVAAEGVEERIALLTEDARRLPMADGSFDVVLSLSCLDALDGEASQARALREVARVLKPGGRVIIGARLPVGRHAQVLREAGLTIQSCETRVATAFAPMGLIEAEKPPLVSVPARALAA